MLIALFWALEHLKGASLPAFVEVHGGGGLSMVSIALQLRYYLQVDSLAVFLVGKKCNSAVVGALLFVYLIFNQLIGSVLWFLCGFWHGMCYTKFK